MKNLFLFILILTTLPATALDNLGRIKASEAEMQQKPRLHTLDTSDRKIVYTSMLVEIADDEALVELDKIGAIIAGRRENILLIYLPDDMLGELDKIHKVTGCATGRQARINLDRAVKASNASEVLAGTGFDLPYTGKGVTVGFSDLGFDPGHAAFAGRVKAVVHCIDTTATVVRALSPAEIEAWTTDSPNDFHATHVGGILAGADESSPYQGVARGADIVATTSTLDDVSILVGVEEVIARAKEAGQPAVVNLSLGSTLGPHDGSDLFCRYLDLCAEDAAILLSAGNDGYTRVHASATLTSDEPTMSVMVESTNWSNVMLSQGYIDIWNDRPGRLDVRFRIWDIQTRGIVWESEWVDPSGEEIYAFDSKSDSEFDEIFGGQILAAAELSPYNNRYNATIGISLRSKIYYPGEGWSRYNLVVDVRGGAGDRVELYSDGKIDFYASSPHFQGITGGTSDNSISSMACGMNTICVGSATTRDITPQIDGGEKSWSPFVIDGTVSSYTAYGTTFDGRNLPHFCAPGSYIVSAYNRYVLEKYPTMLSEMAAESPGHPGHYYFAECGTSMASPHAAGIFALWLEANPSLTGTELRDIAMRTARYEGCSADDPRSGAGMIDAAAGLAYILHKSGISDAVSDGLIRVWRDGDRLGVSGCDATDPEVEIFNLSGVRIFAGRAEFATLPCEPIIVRLTSASFTVTRKLM